MHLTIFFNFVILSSLVFLSMTACDSKTKESINRKSVDLGGNQRIVITQKFKTTRYRGKLTGTDYGTKTSFDYTFKVLPGGIKWRGKSSVPKHLLICKNTYYLHFMYKRGFTKDTSNIDMEKLRKTNYKKYAKYKHTIVAFRVIDEYSVHVDKRYFFKWFGDQYWNSIKKSVYENAKKTCQEKSIPNFNDLGTNK